MDHQNGLLLSIRLQADSVNAEVEAMKAENAGCAMLGQPPKFLFRDFNDKAIQLYHLSNDARGVY